MLNYSEARSILARLDLDQMPDFHALPARKVDEILQFANAHKYRAPRKANGSRGRYFYAYLCRRATRPYSCNGGI